MTKKKKILNGIIFLVGLVIFVFYYLEDNGDMEKVEKEQGESAQKSVPSMADDLNASFDDADTEDIVESGCSVGFIQNQDDTCSKCTAGTFANTAADTNQVCESCAYDTYSGDEATECTACGTGLGTLEIGSDTAGDCTSMYSSSLIM